MKPRTARRIQHGFHRFKLQRPTSPHSLAFRQSAASRAAAAPASSAAATARAAAGEGLTLIHFWLNLSDFCGIGGACMDCLGVVEGVIRGCLGGVRGCQGVSVGIRGYQGVSGGV